MANIRQRFTATSGAPLAIDPKAYGEEFFCFEIASYNPVDTTSPHHSVVSVDGPIAYGTSCFWQTYEGIKSWVAAACGASAPIVTMRINSPGGDVAGAFDCARDIRRMCDAAGKKLIVHVEGQCQSAGYALASQAHEIAVAGTAVVGSIGVIAKYETAIANAAAQGVSHTIVASGAYKADGDPHTPIDDSMRGRLQGLVDAAAGQFFQLVAEGRGLDVEAIRALQAGSLMGQAAVDAGLANSVLSWTDYCARIAADGTIQPLQAATAVKEPDAMSDRDDIRAGLTRQCKSDDPVEAARAKKALAAYDESEPDGDEDKDGDQKAKAASEDDKAKAEDGKPDPKASAAAPDDKEETKALAALANQVSKLTAEAEAGKLQALWTSRPDIGEALRKTLSALGADKAAAIVAGMPVAGQPIDPRAALPVATAGALPGQFDSSPEGLKAATAALPPEIRQYVDRSETAPGVTHYAHSRLYLGGMPAEGSR